MTLTLKEATLNQLLDELFERTRWVALACQANEIGTLIVCEGPNGFEILGGIALLQQSQTEAIRRVLAMDREDVSH